MQLILGRLGLAVVVKPERLILLGLDLEMRLQGVIRLDVLVITDTILFYLIANQLSLIKD